MSEYQTELFLNPPLWFRMLGQILCLGAIQLCCERQLARWVAFNRASPPKTITKADGEPLPRISPPRTRAKFEAAYNMFISLLMIIPSALGLMRFWTEDNFSSRLVVDGAWTCVLLHIWTSAFSDALYGLFPRQRYLRKFRGRGDLSEHWDFGVDSEGSTSGFRWANPLVNKCAGFICAAGLVLSCYTGRHVFIPIAAAAQVISMLVSSFAVIFRMKYMVMIQTAVMLIFTSLGGWIFLISASDQQGVEEVAKIYGQPSPWVLNIMCFFSYTVAHAIPGAFMLVNMRYEYSRTVAPTTTRSPGESVLIDHRVNPPFLPLHHLSIYSFIVCYALIDALYYFDIESRYGTDVIILVVLSISTTVGGTALYTSFRGDFKDWWSYSENYRPQIDFDKYPEVEVGEDLKVDEKRPISP